MKEYDPLPFLVFVGQGWLSDILDQVPSYKNQRKDLHTKYTLSACSYSKLNSLSTENDA